MFFQIGVFHIQNRSYGFKQPQGTIRCLKQHAQNL